MNLLREYFTTFSPSESSSDENRRWTDGVPKQRRVRRVSLPRRQAPKRRRCAAEEPRAIPGRSRVRHRRWKLHRVPESGRLH